MHRQKEVSKTLTKGNKLTKLLCLLFKIYYTKNAKSDNIFHKIVDNSLTQC